ncbi:NnrS family protein [Pseudogulbenkiania sp. MAI-1]|uniref:NnrS family protein n=1 Tax=Pseudogulbenkiania sp. MAI-1 TaxID=990370 RepID=UPI0009FD5D24|nr:NnrS family protein [Pseudogulbenkiania sp. MAI-1]
MPPLSPTPSLAPKPSPAVTIPAFLQAPHRVAFLPGMVFAIVLLAGWSLEMSSRVAGFALPLSIPATLAHGFLMLYGIFPFFMTGFILTAGPRWLNVAAPSRRSYLAIPALMAAGLVLWLAGLAFGSTLSVAGLLSYTLGFAGLVLVFGKTIAASPQADRRHAIAVELAFAVGLAGLLAALYWLLSGDITGWAVMRDLALWGFLLPVFLTVSHRMVPFFSSTVLTGYQAWRPNWLLYALLAGSFGHGLLHIAAVTTLPADLPLTVLLAYTSWRWRLRASLSVRLLGMLHLAFAWLAIGFALYTLQDVAALFGHNLLGLAPLHAITTGFFLTMVIAFVTRVSLGHSGRPLEASPGVWRLYLAAQWMALARVLADILPAGLTGLLYVLAACGWLLTLLCWGRLFIPIYLKRREDGKPG